jgi:hypothetical protein
LKGLGVLLWEGSTLEVERDFLENFMEEGEVRSMNKY